MSCTFEAYEYNAEMAIQPWAKPSKDDNGNAFCYTKANCDPQWILFELSMRPNSDLDKKTLEKKSFTLPEWIWLGHKSEIYEGWLGTPNTKKSRSPNANYNPQKFSLKNC